MRAYVKAAVRQFQNETSAAAAALDGRPLADMPPVVSELTLQIPKGSSCLLIGPNGAGKTTFLKILGGKHMVSENAVTILGEPPFHATTLTAAGKLAYLGGNWDRDIAFAGYSIPLQVFPDFAKSRKFPASSVYDTLFHKMFRHMVMCLCNNHGSFLESWSL